MGHLPHPGGHLATGEPFSHRAGHFARELRVESNALCRRRPAKSEEEKVVVAEPERARTGEAQQP